MKLNNNQLLITQKKIYKKTLIEKTRTQFNEPQFKQLQVHHNKEN